MKYIDLSYLSATIRRNLHKIPHDIDLIIGVPRSGMLCGLIVAEYLNAPIIDIDSFCAGIQPSGGLRLGLFNQSRPQKERRKVLVLDDTVFTGGSIKAIKEKLIPFSDKEDFIYASIFLEGDGENEINIYLEDLRCFRRNANELLLYEWNIFHQHPFVMESCMYDIDGVLCVDPPDDKNTIAYESYIQNAVPLITPTGRIGTIVSYRLIKYWDVTDEWLKSHHITYNSLYLFDAQSREERNQSNISPAQFKAEYYARDRKARLFVESNDNQARQIYEITHKPVFCVETNIMYGNQ